MRAGWGASMRTNWTDRSVRSSSRQRRGRTRQRAPRVRGRRIPFLGARASCSPSSASPPHSPDGGRPYPGKLGRRPWRWRASASKMLALPGEPADPRPYPTDPSDPSNPATITQLLRPARYTRATGQRISNRAGHAAPRRRPSRNAVTGNRGQTGRWPPSLMGVDSQGPGDGPGDRANIQDGGWPDAGTVERP